jgi:hypothetical protein
MAARWLLCAVVCVLVAAVAAGDSSSSSDEQTDEAAQRTTESLEQQQAAAEATPSNLDGTASVSGGGGSGVVTAEFDGDGAVTIEAGAADDAGDVLETPRGDVLPDGDDSASRDARDPSHTDDRASGGDVVGDTPRSDAAGGAAPAHAPAAATPSASASATPTTVHTHTPSTALLCRACGAAVFNVRDNVDAVAVAPHSGARVETEPDLGEGGRLYQFLIPEAAPATLALFTRSANA